MLFQTEGIIHLAEQRASTANGFLTEMPVLQIYDLYLEGGMCHNRSITDEQVAWVIPYIGDLVAISLDNQQKIEENQALIGLRRSYQIVNPYADDSINFYEIVADKSILGELPSVISIDVQTNKNTLLPLSSSVLIGQFDGRMEAVHTRPSPKNKLFVYVIAGAFEVQNRLLQPHDGLTLWHVEELEMEALSDDAVLLIIEL